MKWMEAVKIYNQNHNPGMWCMPKKGSPEHALVKRIQAGEKIEQKGILKKGAPKKVSTMNEQAETPKAVREIPARSPAPPTPKAPVQGQASKKLAELRARNARLAEIKENVKKALAKRRIAKAINIAAERRLEKKAEAMEAEQKAKAEPKPAPAPAPAPAAAGGGGMGGGERYAQDFIEKEYTTPTGQTVTKRYSVAKLRETLSEFPTFTVEQLKPGKKLTLTDGEYTVQKKEFDFPNKFYVLKEGSTRSERYERQGDSNIFRMPFKRTSELNKYQAVEELKKEHEEGQTLFGITPEMIVGKTDKQIADMIERKSRYTGVKGGSKYLGTHANFEKAIIASNPIVVPDLRHKDLTSLEIAIEYTQGLEMERAEKEKQSPQGKLMKKIEELEYKNQRADDYGGKAGMKKREAALVELRAKLAALQKAGKGATVDEAEKTAKAKSRLQKQIEHETEMKRNDMSQLAMIARGETFGRSAADIASMKLIIESRVREIDAKIDKLRKKLATL